MNQETLMKIKAVGENISGKEAKKLVQEDPCFALLVLQSHGTYTRTGELLVQYFGGIAKMYKFASESDCPDVDLGILQQV